MPSNSLQNWKTTRAVSLNEIEGAHRSVGGHGRGRRYATQQINQAYAVLLSSQFQGFCRDLHSESVEGLIDSVAPAAMRAMLRREFTWNRKLDRGNPNPGNIGEDFGRLGIDFWDRVRALDARNRDRQALLEELNLWRNAIAHQDFDPAKLGGVTTLHLRQVQRWRNACEAPAPAFDEAMRSYVQSMAGVSPW